MSNTTCVIPPPSLTFSHRSGVTPYTSSCEFAWSCVFGKQSPGRLSLRPFFLRKGRPYTEGTAAFLPSSLKINHSYPLGFSPYPPVSVYGTDPLYLILEVFLGRLFDLIDLVKTKPFLCFEFVIKDSFTDLPVKPL